MALVNIDKLYLAIQEKDELGAGNLAYELPEYIPGIQQFGTKLKVDTGLLFEEGKQIDQDSIISSIDISLDLGHLSNAQYAKYLGHHVASGGGVYALIDDKAPYIAILIEYTKNGGKKGWKVFYKGQLTEPDDAVKQTEGKVNYQNHTVTASFQPLKNNGMWKYTVEEGDPNCPSDIATTFFNNVIIPDLDNTIPTVVTTPTDGATGVATNADIVFTFSSPMQIATINDNNIFLIKADGTPVASSLALDETGKIATLHPTAVLTAGSYIAICTKNVRSNGNVALAANTVVNFTV